MKPFIYKEKKNKYCTYQFYSDSQLTTHHQTEHSAAGSVPAGNHSESRINLLPPSHPVGKAFLWSVVNTQTPCGLVKRYSRWKDEEIILLFIHTATCKNCFIVRWKKVPLNPFLHGRLPKHSSQCFSLQIITAGDLLFKALFWLSSPENVFVIFILHKVTEHMHLVQYSVKVQWQNLLFNKMVIPHLC